MKPEITITEINGERMVQFKIKKQTFTIRRINNGAKFWTMREVTQMASNLEDAFDVLEEVTREETRNTIYPTT